MSVADHHPQRRRHHLTAAQPAVGYAPNALGQATQAGSWATGVQYHPNGAVKQFSYGNGLVHTMTQNARQLPLISADSGGALNQTYYYDQNGNVRHVDDGLDNVRDRWMAYDGLDRLTDAGAVMFGGDHWHRFSYDALDNLRSWKLAGVKDLANYVYDANHRLTSIQTSGGATVHTFAFDPQGNLSNKNSVGHDFDFGNRLREVTGQEYYRYDGHGRRALAWRPVGGSTLSMYSQGGQVMYQHAEPKGFSSEHIYLAGSLVASREWAWATSTLSTKYQHTDALGSPIAVSNEAGTIIDRTNYDPYGGPINKVIDGIGYTGHVMDPTTGLTNMQQRYYDQGVGRFLSVDPVTAIDNGDMRHFNRYAYAYNNPYVFTDPDGRQGCADTKAQGLSGACVQSTNSSVENQRSNDAVARPSTDGAARQNARQTNQSSGNERVARVDVTQGEDGSEQAKVSPVETTHATPTGAEFPASAVEGAEALIHTHPTDANDIVPGRGDASLPERGIPNYVSHGKRSVVVEISGGQYRARVVEGKLTPSERRNLQKRLNEFQRENPQ